MQIRKASFLIPAAIASLSFPLHASAQDATAQATSQTTAQAATHPITPEELALIDRYLTAVQAEVAGKIDTRNAAAGQQVTARTSRNATLADGTVLPKDTKLVGRIVRAQAFEKEHSGAVLAMLFDHAELKDGKSIPIRCVIRMVAPIGNARMNDDPMMASGLSRGDAATIGGGGLSPISGPMGSDSPLGASAPIGGGSIDSSPLGGSSPMGGNGSNGGMGGGSRNGAGNTSGSNGTRGGLGTGIGGIGASDPGIGAPAGSVEDRTRAALGTATSVAAATTERPVATAGERITDAPRRTRLPGIMLSNSSAVGLSGVFTAFDRNINLSNTLITFGVIVTGR
ncbi:MAG TPA: hypothetical protein VGJ21_00015 [Terracidiphilus sp.]|jgi:hypothetical protein